MDVGYRAERLFAELCGRHFLRGFVFHSPRYSAPTEHEAGDVVIWVRRQVVVVEVMARDADPGASTKQFVKRIGKKRDQLLADYAAYTDSSVQIELVNETGESIAFELTDLDHVRFSGIVLIDHDGPLDKAHVGSIAKTLDAPFPIAVMTRRDFLDLLDEVDTVPDLSYYLADRADFVRRVFPDDARPFLKLDVRLERNLVAYYKLHDNSFPSEPWVAGEALAAYDRYRAERRDDIAARDAENAGSYLIDELADEIRNRSMSTDSTLLHAAELASFTRRQRAVGLASRVERGLGKMTSGGKDDRFAVFNPATGCWCVFYFHHGSGSAAFDTRARELTRRKLLVEMVEHDFEYSVFGYAFRKSTIETGATFDHVILSVEDASSYESVSESEYHAALADFGARSEIRAPEFPGS